MPCDLGVDLATLTDREIAAVAVMLPGLGRELFVAELMRGLAAEAVRRREGGGDAPPIRLDKLADVHPLLLPKLALCFDRMGVIFKRLPGARAVAAAVAEALRVEGRRRDRVLTAMQSQMDGGN